MTWEFFWSQVSKVKKRNLMGAKAHELMMPAFRTALLQQIDFKKLSPKKAAVLMLLYPKNEMVYFALIVRQISKGVHSGQVALPGGTLETQDRSLEHTALREAEEEIDVPKEKVKILQNLTPVYIPPSNFWVHPFLGYTKDLPTFIPQKSEVSEILEIPIKALLDQKNIRNVSLSTSYAEKVEVPCFIFEKHTVWGATAMILSEVKRLIQDVM